MYGLHDCTKMLKQTVQYRGGPLNAINVSTTSGRKLAGHQGCLEHETILILVVNIYCTLRAGGSWSFFG